ncbi:MAG: hypothetical protein WA705_07880 [Candidatus Ozemobacteraceae bacterium]
MLSLLQLRMPEPRKSVFRLFFPAILVLLLVVSTAEAVDLPTDARFFFMGSSLLTMPTGYINSGVAYINDVSRSSTMYSIAPLGKYLEISGQRYLSGAYKDKNPFNLKVNILEEDTVIPNVVYGIADWSHELGSRISYFAASKKLETLGMTLHGGFLRDPVTTAQRSFYGIEKTIYSKFCLAGERFDDRNTVGLKFRPYQGISIEYARRLDEPGVQQQLYKLVYTANF